MNEHISESYEQELRNVRNALMEMGGVVEQQVRSACQAFVAHDGELAGQVHAADRRVNQLELEIDDQCVQIIARRQPAATDLRTLVAAMKASTDLERVGDEADRIAKMAAGLAGAEPPIDQYGDIRRLSADVIKMLSASLDALARQDADQAAAIKRADGAVDAGYDSILREQLAAMQEHPQDIEQRLSIIWAARSLERIGDHAKNIGEYVVYLVEGEDVRHPKLRGG